MKKRFCLGLVCSLLLLISGCEQYASINDLTQLENRVAALENICGQMNTNISSLQTLVTALQNKDYITSITPITQNGETIGYIITFTQSGPITIYHGKVDQDGTNGEGYTPTISVKRDTDGVYYWTLDGTWLLDETGAKIRAEGKDGADGKNGVTPQLKIESDYWYVSYDNGTTWTKLGKITGGNSANGTDGDSMFKNVTVNETEVIFEMTNGQNFTIPRSTLEIEFEMDNLTLELNTPLKVKYQIKGSTNDIIVEALSTSDIKVMVFHNGTSGYIEIKAIDNIDEYSKVVILLSDGMRTVLRTLTFEEMIVKIKKEVEGQEDAAVEIAGEGEELVLEFYSNTDEYDVIVADEDKDWIEVIATKAMNLHSVTLRIKPNGGEARETKVRIETKNNHHTLEFGIKQKKYEDVRNAENLSIVETANCYIVEKKGSYSFDATIIGNGTKGIMPGYGFHTSNATISPVATKLLWQDHDIVSNLTLQNGRVYFDATSEKGNAVIAVMDPDSTILWSWHIWATDRPQDVQLSTATHTYLDRNLGATSVQKNLPSSQGLYYQWGRKDPFRKAESTVELAPNPLTIRNLIQNPEVMYQIEGSAYMQTRWVENDAALWGNPDGEASVATFKTIYDPCPPGYTIPSDAAWYEYGYNQIFFETHRYYSRIDPSMTIINDEFGMEVSKDGKTIVYPLSDRFMMDDIQSGCPYMRNTGISGANASTMYLIDGGFTVNFNSPKSWGASVRCIKEETYQGFPPTVKTDDCSQVRIFDLVVKGTVTNNGNTPLHSVGFYWGLTQNEMTNRIEIKPTATSFSYHLENLPANATVYVRSFAENDAGFSWGNLKIQRLYSATEYAAIDIDSLSRFMSKQYMSTQGFNGEGTIKTWYGNFGNDLQRCNQTGWANLWNHQYNDKPTSTYCIYPWFYYYKIIGKANQVIAIMNNDTSGIETERQFLKAQALTFRAHAFTMLAQLYCRRWADGASNPGLFLSLDANVGNLQRATVKETFAQIYADLDEAISLFQASGRDRGSDEFYKPNLQVAYAVYTRAALVREDWQTVARTAPLARQGHPLMSRSEYMNGGFSDVKGVPDEWIWGVYETAERTLYFYGFFAYQASDASSSMQRTYPLAISKELYEQIPATDARRKMWLEPTPEEWAACDAAGRSTGALYSRAFAEFGNKLYSTSLVYGYMQFKFQATFLPGGGSFNIYRAAEMYLAEAEALCHIGGQDAKVQSLLKELNKNLDDSYDCTKIGADLLTEVKLYRRIDLWGEGFDYYDYKRWNEPIVRKSIADGGSFHPSFAITINPEDGNHWTWVLPENYETYIREGSVL